MKMYTFNRYSYS